jgi:hypothetical protein
MFLSTHFFTSHFSKKNNSRFIYKWTIIENIKDFLIITKADKGKTLVILPLVAHNNETQNFKSQEQCMKLNADPNDHY